MNRVNKYWPAIIFPVIILLAGCSREIEDLVSPPIDSSTIPPTPSNLNAEIGDGLVSLTWEISDSSLVSEYNIYRADSVAGEFSPIGTTQSRSFTADNLQNGLLYLFRISAVNSAGYEGYKSDPVSAVPELYSVLINIGEEYTNVRDVTLGFTAPAGTRFTQISSDSLFAGAQWETFALTRSYRLESGDGAKTVYCRFRDVADRITWRFFSDSIILDTEAFIDSIAFSPSGPFSPGEIVHFALFSNEADGQAVISIGSDITGIELFDNGRRGDGIAGNGVYELDFTIPAFFDFEDKIVTGEFIDRAGNIALVSQADNRFSVRRPPDAVSIFSINAPAGFHDQLNLNWEESDAQDFGQYRVYRAESPGVDSTDYLVGAILSIGENSISDTGLTANTTYYYKVYVVDITDLWTGSGEVSAMTGIDSPPEAVDLYPVITLPDLYQQIDIEWSQSPDFDFESYRLYRWQESIGRADSILAGFFTNQITTTFTDSPQFNTSQDTLNLWYIIHVYDDAGNSTPSDSVRARLVDAVPPTVSGSVTPSDSSLVITWSQSEIPDFGSYRLLRDTDSNPSGALTVFVSSSASAITYEDDSALEGQTYYYWLDIYDLRGNNSRSVLGSGAW